MALVADGFKYSKQVISGKIDVCKYAQLSCKRFQFDLKTADQRDFYFDKKAAQRILTFFSYLKHYKGEWAGQPFILEPWQTFILINIFGWKIKSTGLRRFETVYLEIPRKNGKTFLAAGIGLYLLIADSEPGAEIYSAATKKDQAKLCFKDAYQMVKGNDHLDDLLETHKTAITYLDNASFFMPMSSESKKQDGLNAHGVIADEIHAWKNRDLLEVFETGMGARRQGLILQITTAGPDPVCLATEERDYLIKLLQEFDFEAGFHDDSYFGIIWGLDDSDLIVDAAADQETQEKLFRDEKLWKKANPNYGISAKVKYFKSKSKKALEIISKRPHFLTKNLNVWVNSDKIWLDMLKWKRSGESFDPLTLNGRPCYAGLDLSSKIDLSALVLAFPPYLREKDWKFICKAYCPESRILAGEKQDKAPYIAWRDKGFLTATPGSAIDYDFIAKDLNDLNNLYRIQGVGFDPWQASGFATEREKEGVPMIEIRQGFKSMSEPSKEFEMLLEKLLISHNNNPAFTWCAGNTKIRKDQNENYMPDKSKSTGRIDLIVAAIMALSISKYEIKKPSAYKSRGLLTT